MPPDFYCVDVMRDDAVGVEIVALAHLSDPLRTWLAFSIEDQILLRIVAAADPDRTSADLERIAGPGFAAGIAGLLRNRVPGPQVLAVFGVVGLNEPAWRVAAHNHFAFGNQRRLAGETPRQGDFRFPYGMSRARIDGNERTIDGCHEEGVVINRRAALSAARQRRPLILPDDVAAAPIQVGDSISLREVL